MFTIDNMPRRSQSIIGELLKALVPYSEQNFKLAFKPKLFFSDLESCTSAHHNTIKSTFSRAIQKGYITTQNGKPMLSALGKTKIPAYFRPPLLKDYLIIAFDIPETRRSLRSKLRRELQRREFKQLQKSVWFSKYDYGMEVAEIVMALKISRNVSFIYGIPLTSSRLKLTN